MSNNNTTWRIPFGNETFCYKWYEEYQKFSYCPTEEPKSTHPGKENSDNIFTIYTSFESCHQWFEMHFVEMDEATI